MSKEPTKPESSLGVALIGTPKDGQKVALGREKSLEAIFGTKHPEMAEALLGHCLKVLKSTEASDDHPGNDERAFMIAAIAELKPRDAVERMLAVQMAATHVAMIRSGRWLPNCDRLDQVQAHYAGYTKLARTYTAQVEALRKHRNGGKQTVTVQHVNVEGGGQAIVGSVNHGGGLKMKSDANPMNPTQRLRDAPRCTATAKRTGERCSCPAERGCRVCRVHGTGVVATRRAPLIHSGSSVCGRRIWWRSDGLQVT